MQLSRRKYPTPLSLVMWLMIAASALAAAPAVQQSPKRAKPPTWSQEVLDVFFEDAREHLSGPRPEPSPRADAAPRGEAPAVDANDASKKFAWSQLVTADALATDIKRLAAGLREPLANASRFNADGHLQCQASFSQLAVLFAVIAEYDGEVRWQDDAPRLRDDLARAARNCQQASEQSLAEALERAADVEEVVRGGRLADRDAVQFKADMWSALAERPQLMQRVQLAFRDRIQPQLSDARQLKKSAVEVRHEAQMLALLAELIRRPQYEYWDDETFAQYARDLQRAATDLSQAAAAENYDAARTAVTRAGRACADCHDGYRL